MSPKSLDAASEPFLLISAVPTIGPMIPPLHAQPTPSQTQIEAAQKAAMAELAKRKTQRPVDKNIPEGVEDIIIGNGVQQYKRLREFERKLDAVMMRKRIEFHNARRGSFTRDRMLKIWVSNTVENQPWQGRSLETDSYDFIPELEGIYKVKIEGRLMDEEVMEPPAENGTGANNGDAAEHKEEILNDPEGETSGAAESTSGWRSKTKLSHFFKAIAVDFGQEKELQADNSPEVEWKKPTHRQNPVMPPAADFDCLEFERKSEENINCVIKFYRDEYPERFRLSEALAGVLDTDEADRDSIIFGIWDYVKAMNLQQDEEKRLAQCDERLWAVSLPCLFACTITLIIGSFSAYSSNPKLISWNEQVFHSDTFFFPEISKLIQPHLSPLPPVSIPYTIRVDPQFHSSDSPPSSTSYLIPVSVPSSLLNQQFSLIHPPSFSQLLGELAEIDNEIAVLVQAIGRSKAKHAFMSEMSRDPVSCVNKWVSSQKRDLEMILGEIGKGEDGMGEEWRKGGKDGVWGSDIVRESVGLIVQKAR